MLRIAPLKECHQHPEKGEILEHVSCASSSTPKTKSSEETCKWPTATLARTEPTTAAEIARGRSTERIHGTCKRISFSSREEFGADTRHTSTDLTLKDSIER